MSIERKDIFTDDAIGSPLIMAEGFDKLAESVEKLLGLLKQSSQNIKAADSTAKLAKETSNLTLAQVEQEKITKQLAVAQARQNEEYQLTKKQVADLNKEIKVKNELGDRDAKTVTRQNASLKQLEIALAKNREARARLTTEEARASKEGMELLNIIQNQDKAVKELKGEMGQHQDKVGDYAGAMAGLKQELKEARGEMVTLAETLGQSSQQYQDAAKRAGEIADKIKDANEEAKAFEGEPIEQLGVRFGLLGDKLKGLDFKGAETQLRGIAEISRQMTFKEAIAGLGGFANALGTLGKAIITNPIFILAATLAAAVVAYQLYKDRVDRISAGIIRNHEKELASIEKRYDFEIAKQQITGENTIKTEIAKQKAIIATSNSAIKAAGDVTKVDLAQSILQGRIVKSLDEAKLKSLEGFYRAKTSANEALKLLEVELTQFQIQQDKEVADKRKEQALKEAGDLFNLQKFRIQNSIDADKAIVDSDKKSLEERADAALQMWIDREKLAELEKENALKQSDLTVSGKKLIEEQYLKESEEANKEYYATLDKLRSEQKLKTISDLKAENEAQLAELQKQIDDRVNLIKQEVIEGKKTREQGDKEINAFLKSQADELINKQIEGLNKLLSNQSLTAQEEAEIQKQLYKLKNDLVNAYYTNLDEKGKTQLEKDIETLTTFQSLYQQFADGIIGIMDGVTERRLQAIDKEEKAFERSVDEQIRLAGDNDRAKEEIEIAAEARREEFERKRIAAERKAAILNKSLALTEAAITTSLNVLKGLGTPPVPNIPLAALAGALGAIQIAAIASKPIPQYFLGTPEGGHKGGIAMVGERGVELGITPQGERFLTPGTATLMNLPKGTEIIPNKETMKALASEDSTLNLFLLEKAIVKSNKEVVRAIIENSPDYVAQGSLLMKVQKRVDGSRKITRSRSMSS